MGKVFIRVPIEVDITYVNKTWYSYHTKKDEKHYVIGIYQRQGQAIIKALPDNKPETIHAIMLECVEKGCMVYVEEGLLPESLKPFYEITELKTSKGQYVNGDIHVNHVKNMWKDLKRVIKRTHIHVSQKHLQLYCHEVTWRVNTRDLSAMEKFNLALSNCAIPRGKTTFKQLTE